MKIENEEDYQAKSTLLRKLFEDGRGSLKSTPELTELIDALFDYEQIYHPIVPEPWGVLMEEFEETLKQAALPSNDPRKRD